MSKTIVGKILAAILDVFKAKFPKWLSKEWNNIPEQLKVQLIDIVNIVNEIKKYADLPFFDAIVKITATTKDDNALLFLRSVLSEIASVYGTGNKLVRDFKRGDWQTVASELTVSKTGLPFEQSAITIENTYQNTKIQTKAA